MTLLAALACARAELMYRLCLLALAVPVGGRDSIPALVRIYRAVEYWDRQRACSRSRV